MPETSERNRVVAALLRQLSIGLSAYRLYPGDLSQAGFVAATRRIETAADAALAGGVVRVEVTGRGFADEDGGLVGDEGAERLARASYDRRVERMIVESMPSPQDLAALYDVLTRPPDDVIAAGGADVLLRVAGVTSIALRELDPLGVPAAEAGEREPTSEDPAIALDLAALQEALELTESMAELSGGAPSELAEVLFSRFRAVVASLPPEMSASLELYRALHTIVEALPPEQRVLLESVLLERSLDDPLAERYVGTMSDTELARVIVDVARAFGRDPAEMAGGLAARRRRSGDLIELTVSVATGQIDAGSVVAGLSHAGLGLEADRAAEPEEAGSGDRAERDRMVYETVSDLLGKSLLAQEEEDMEVLRSTFPQGDGEQLETAAAAVHDYLFTETDVDRLHRVMVSWTGTARQALRDGDVDGVRRSMAVLEGVRADREEGAGRVALLSAYRQRLPQGDVLREVVERTRRDGEHERTAALLRPIGPAAIVGLLDLLAEDPDSGGRGVILPLATALAHDHFDVVADRVRDPRVAVARDALAVAHRAGGERALPLLDAASRHPDPGVREEAVNGFVSVAGARAVDHLRDLALDHDPRVGVPAVVGLGGLVVPEAARALAQVAESDRSRTVRHEALDRLAAHRSGVAAEALARLSTRRGGRNLPRSLRRRARQLARRRGA